MFGTSRVTGRWPTVDDMVARQETHPGRCGRRARRSSARLSRAMRRGQAAPRGPLRGDARAAAHRAVRVRAVGDVTVDGDDVGTGRLILLHDPPGNDAWDGDLPLRRLRPRRDRRRADHRPDARRRRLVLADRGARRPRRGVHTASGTVTRVATESFGGMADDSRHRPARDPGVVDADVPVGARRRRLDVTPHVEAWGELLCTAVGLPPVPDGVAVIPSRRGQRGSGA